MSVPTNLIPAKITGLPEYTGSSQAGYFPYVLDGTSYKVQFSSVASAGEVPPSRTITAGTGLVGGGDLSANRIFAIANGGVGANQLDTTGVVAGVYGNGSNVPTVTVDANGRVTSVTTSPVVATGYVPESRTITAGTGLIGGGSLANNITLSLNLSSATPQALGNATAGVSTAAARGDHVHPAVNLGDTNQTQGALPLGRGGTGDALSPVAGAVVYSTGSKLALTNPGTAGQVLVSGGADEPVWSNAGAGTVTSVNASGGTTGMTFTGGPITLSGTLTLGGTLATGSGGTGLTGTPTNGQLLIGNGTGYALSTLTAGTAVSITNAAGSITIDNTAPDQIVSMTAGTAISVTGTYPNFTIGNTAPDQIVSLTAGTAISVTGTYPNFTVTNTAPDQIVSLTGAGTTSISGTYPNFTITSNDQFTGTVTSVAASGGTTGLTFSGSPITTAGTLTLGGTLAVASGGTGATTASGARTNLGAAASGANSDITSLSGITGGISTADFVAFDTTNVTPPTTGQLAWNLDDGTLDVGLNGGSILKVGQQTLFYAKNTSGGTIPLGTPVMFTGVVGASGKLTFGLAVANGSVPPEYMMGVTTQNVVNNDFGYIASFGLVRGFNTSGAPYGETWADGDLLYFSPATPGGWTKVEPQAPNIHVPVAVVVNAATGGSGSIFVRMIQSERLGELQDVEINGGGPAAGQVLIYDPSQSRWENNTLTAGSNVTITNGNGSITIAATEQFTGTVTSVAASGGTTGLTFSGSPITSAGTLTLGGTLAIGSGGTGATTAGGARTALGAAASGANTDITSIALTSGTILNAPTSGTDIVNKAYADSIAAGINFHQSVRLATVAPLPANTYNNGSSGVGATLTANANGALSIDGVAVVAGNRVLVKDEVAQANNGVYVVTQTGSGSTPYILTRATDFNTAGSGVNQIDAGDFFFVTAGNTLANTSWVQQTPLPITVGTTAIVFSQFGAPVLYSAGTGLSLAGTVFSIANTGVSASTYGSASQVPVLAVNAQGQITSASNTSISIAASQVTSGSLAVARGGTGLSTTPTNGQLLIGNGTGYSLSTLSAGTGISVSNGSGSVTVTNTAPDQIVTITGGGATVVTGTYPNFTVSTTTGTGTVTSVDVSGGSTGLSFTGGPITSSGIITMGGTLGVANGGTGTATAFTAGSVVFAGASGVYSQDNANLFWDDANNRLGIGTTSPAERLAVAGNVQATQGTYCFTGVTSGTVQGQLAANEGGAAVQLRAVSNHPLAFFTNNTERARITAAGDVGIGTTSPNSRLDSAVSASGAIATPFRVTNSASATVSPGQGAQIGFANDSGWGAALAGAVRSQITNTGNGASAMSFHNWNGSALTEYMRITSAGNVGIGTTTPGARLDVSDAGTGFVSFAPANASTSLVMRLGYATDFSQITADSFGGNLLIGADESNTKANSFIAFRTDATERMRLDSAGNLGLGVTPSAWGSSRTAIDLGTNSYVGGVTQSNLTTNIYFDGSNFRYKDTAPAAIAQIFNNIFLWQSASSGSAGSVVSLNEYMRLTGAGNLGIGTTAPAARLHAFVASSGNTLPGNAIGIFESAANNGIAVSAPAANAAGVYFPRSTSAYYAGVERNGTNLVFANNDAERARITSDGSMQLSVGGVSNTHQFLYNESGGEIQLSDATGNGPILIDNSGGLARFYKVGSGAISMGTTGANYFQFITNGAERMRIDSSGNLGIGTSTPVARLSISAVGGTVPSFVIPDATNNRYSVGLGSINVFGEGQRLDFYAGDSGANGTNLGSGALRMSLTAAGNFGIGTTAPASLLHVKRGSNAIEVYPAGTWATRVINATDGSGENGLLVGNRWAGTGSTVFEVGSIFGGGTGSWYSYYRIDGTGQSIWSNSGTERMRIDSSGNVGIGTSTPGLYPYGGLLNVAGGISMALGNRLGWGITDSFTLNGVTTAHYGFTYGGGSNFVTASGYYGINFATLGADRMRITTSGNVTIGNSAVDTAALSIARNTSTATVAASSSIVLSNRNTGINGTIAGGIFIDTFRDVADPHYSGGIWFTRNPLASNLTSSSDIVFGSSGFNTSGALPAEIMRLTSGGNLGIGTSSPANRLNVFQNTANVPAIMQIQQGSSGNNFDYASVIAASNSGSVALTSWASGSVRAGTGWVQTVGAIPLVVGVNDTEVARFTTGGNVGIGTSSPGTRLTVAGGSEIGVAGGTSNFYGQKFWPIVGGNSVFNIYADVGQMRFTTGGSYDQTANSNLMVLNAFGALGLGTTSPAVQFHINGTQPQIQWSNPTTGATSNDGTHLYLSGSDFWLVNKETAAMVFATNNTERARINSGGEFLIGTSSGGRTVCVNAADNWIRQSNPSRSWLHGMGNQANYIIWDETGGGARFTVDTSGNWLGTNAIILGQGFNNDNRIEVGSGRTGNNFAYIDLIGDTTYTDYGLRLLRGNSGPNTFSQLFHRGTGDFAIGNADAAALTFRTSDTERMRFEATGNAAFSSLIVGRPTIGSNVNTNNDTGSLSVRGDASNAASISFHRVAAFAINMGLGTDAVFRIGGWSASSNCFQMDASGNLTMLGNVTAYSDARIKKDVETIGGALDLVSKMRGVRYTRTDTDKRGVGVIAQEMLEVVPEVVQQGVGDDDTLSVAYGNLVGVLIEAIKELRAEVAELKGK